MLPFKQLVCISCTLTSYSELSLSDAELLQTQQKVLVTLMYFTWNLCSCVYVCTVQTFCCCEELTSRCVWKKPGPHEEEAALVKQGFSSLCLYLCIIQKKSGSYNTVTYPGTKYCIPKRSPATWVIIKILSSILK